MPSLESRAFKRLLTRSLLLPVPIMILLAVLFVWQIQSLMSAAKWVDHTDEVIAQTHLTLELALDTQSGQRGYLVGGNPLFLQSYHSAGEQIMPAFRRLAQLVSDNPAQERRERAMEVVYTAWDENARREIAALQQGRDYRRLFNQANSKKLMDQLRAQNSAFVETEQRLRVQRSGAAHLAARNTLLSAGLLTLMLGGLLAFFTRRQLLALSTTYGKALHSVQESEQRFSTTLMSIGDAVIATDAIGKITFVNTTAERLTGWTQSEAAGKEIQEVFPIVNAQTRREVESPVTRVLREGVTVGLANHTVLISKSGMETHIDDSGAPIRNRRGDLTGTVLVFRDISERQALEQERTNLQEETDSRARQQQALAYLGMLALSGVTPSEWMQSIAEVMARSLTIEFSQVLELAPGGKEIQMRAGVGWQEGSGESIGISLDVHSLACYTLLSKSPVIISDLKSETRFDREAILSEHDIGSGINVAVAQSEGKYWGILGVYSRERRSFTTNDVLFLEGVAHLMTLILERHRQEEQINRHNVEIQALNKRLQRAMEETHHRVRNNLQIIAAMVDMQQMEHADTIPPEELQRLATHVRTLAAVHDLLTEQAKKDGQASFLSAKDLLERLHLAFQQTAPNCRFRFRIEDIPLATRRATSLGLIVNELVTNAIKYGNGAVEVTFKAEGEEAILQVCDDGPGLPEQFDPVRSAHTGLSLVENLSQWDLSGLTRYQNLDRGGACITITLPIVSPQEIASPL